MGAKKFFGKVGKSIKDTTSKATKEISSTATKFGDDVASTATKVGDEVASTATKVGDEVASTARNIGDEVASTVKSEAEAAAKFTESAAGDVWNTAMDAVNDVKDLAEDIGSDMKNEFGSSGGTHSPKVNLNCSIPSGFLPNFGTFFKSITLTTIYLTLFFYFIFPLIIAIYVSFNSCKMITLDIFKNLNPLIVLIKRKFTSISILFSLFIVWKIMYAISTQESIATLVPFFILLCFEFVETYKIRNQINKERISTLHPLWSILNKSTNNSKKSN